MNLETTTQNKYVILVIAMAVCAIFQIAGTATPHTSMNVSGVKSTVTFTTVRTCVGGRCSSMSVGDAFDGCGGFKSGSSAGLAFAILAMLALFASIAASVLVLVLKKAMFKQLMPLGLIASFGCMLIAWPIAFALRSSFKCGGSTLADNPNAKVGPCAPLLLISWLMLGAIAAGWFLIKETDGGSDPNNSPTIFERRTTTTTTTTTTAAA